MERSSPREIFNEMLADIMRQLRESGLIHYAEERARGRGYPSVEAMVADDLSGAIERVEMRLIEACSRGEPVPVAPYRYAKEVGFSGGETVDSEGDKASGVPQAEGEARGGHLKERDDTTGLATGEGEG